MEFLDYLKDSLDVPAENIAYVPSKNCKSSAEKAAHQKIADDTDYIMLFYAEDL